MKEGKYELIPAYDLVGKDIRNAFALIPVKSNRKMITADEFLCNTTQEEVFAVFEAVYQRCLELVKKRRTDKNAKDNISQFHYYLIDGWKNLACAEAIKEAKQ